MSAERPLRQKVARGVASLVAVGSLGACASANVEGQAPISLAPTEVPTSIVVTTPDTLTPTTELTTVPTTLPGPETTINIPRANPEILGDGSLSYHAENLVDAEGNTIVEVPDWFGPIEMDMKSQNGNERYGFTDPKTGPTILYLELMKSAAAQHGLTVEQYIDDVVTPNGGRDDTFTFFKVIGEEPKYPVIPVAPADPTNPDDAVLIGIDWNNGIRISNQGLSEGARTEFIPGADHRDRWGISFRENCPVTFYFPTPISSTQPNYLLWLDGERIGQALDVLSEVHSNAVYSDGTPESATEEGGRLMTDIALRRLSLYDPRYGGVGENNPYGHYDFETYPTPELQRENIDAYKNLLFGPHNS